MAGADGAREGAMVLRSFPLLLLAWKVASALAAERLYAMIRTRMSTLRVEIR